MSNKVLYHFEGFRVDTEQNCLWRGEELISLTPKAFQTLVVLIKNQGKVMSKNALLDEVWKDTFVEESTLAQNISTLRKTLAKYEKGKKFISTIPRRGYRFVADVTEINSDEEVLYVEKHSVTHIVAEQERVDEKETAIAHRTKPAKQSNFFSKPLLIGLPLAILAVVAIGFVAVKYFSTPKNFYTSKFQKYRVNNLLSGGNIADANVSPDGKYIISTERKSSGDSITLKQITDGNTIEILPTSKNRIIGTTFSPKGDYVYYSAYQMQETSGLNVGNLYKLPILGGAPEKILEDIDSPVAISKDGTRLAFVRNQPEEKKSLIFISNLDGSDEKLLAEKDLRNGFSTIGLSWSPDGKLISTVVVDRDSEKTSVKVVLVNSETGEEIDLTTKDWLWIGKTAWLRDGSGVAFVAYGSETPNLTDEIWFVSYPEGEARKITSGIKGIAGISLTDNADSIVTTKQTRITSSFVAPLDELENAEEINKIDDEVSLLQLGTDWTHDEKIIYSKTQNGSADIWLMNSDGKKSEQITSNASADYVPTVSADGKYVFFLSNRNNAISIWRMGLYGENPLEIIKGKSFYAPSVSSNNDFIYYSAKSPDEPYNILWKADFDGKNIQKLTSERTYVAKVSPDGKYVLCFYPGLDKDPKDLTNPLKMTILSAEDGKIVKQFASLTSRNFPPVEWNAGSNGFYIVGRGEKSTLLFQDIEEDTPKKLKEWETGTVYQIALSKDGKRLFYEKGEEVTSIIELKDIFESE